MRKQRRFCAAVAAVVVVCVDSLLRYTFVVTVAAIAFVSLFFVVLLCFEFQDS